MDAKKKFVIKVREKGFKQPFDCAAPPRRPAPAYAFSSARDHMQRADAAGTGVWGFNVLSPRRAPVAITLPAQPFRPHCQMDSAQAGQIWKSLRRAIDEIHNKNASVLSFEELYRNAYNLVLHKHGELLYDGVKEAVQEHLEAVAANVAATPDEQLLAVTSTCWSDHQVRALMFLPRRDATSGERGGR